MSPMFCSEVRSVNNGTKHISVCVCTYRRPDLLSRLLEKLSLQQTGGLFTYSVVVVDNDCLESSRNVVSRLAMVSAIPINYCGEPRQNIALARNKAVENAGGDLLAFIDDDEFPAEEWLLTLFKACNEYGVDGVVGPVKRHFDEQPPKWLVKGRFYERPTYSSGLQLDWAKGRTNNLLLKRQMIAPGDQPFRPEFRTGEDQDFFRRMIEKGYVFAWCNEAVVYEVVLPARWRRAFMLRRALLQGTVSVLHPTFRASHIAKSLIAVPVYAAALPVALFVGHHRFMTLLIKLFDHIGRLLALLHVNLIKEPYVTS